MKTKEVKIQIPEGYEIDKEKSTFECIKFQRIKDVYITYENVCNELFKNELGYFINECGEIKCDCIVGSNKFDKTNAINRKQLKRLLALNQLLNIAEYYNKLHTMTSTVCTIMYNKIDKIYYINTSSVTYLYGINVFFNRREDAQAVINNPNFRKILNIVYKF